MLAVNAAPQTADECEKHYFNTYINVPTAPLPDMSRSLDVAAAETSDASTLLSGMCLAFSLFSVRENEHVCVKYACIYVCTVCKKNVYMYVCISLCTYVCMCVRM